MSGGSGDILVVQQVAAADANPQPEGTHLLYRGNDLEDVAEYVMSKTGVPPSLRTINHPARADGGKY